jgi:hypothetical protein
VPNRLSSILVFYSAASAAMQSQGGLHAARKARRTLRCGRRRDRRSTTRSRHDTELADKVLAGETYTEPTTSARRSAPSATPSAACARRERRGVVTLADAMVPDKLEWFGRARPDEDAKRVHDYVVSLSREQKRGLAGPYPGGHPSRYSSTSEQLAVARPMRVSAAP